MKVVFYRDVFRRVDYLFVNLIVDKGGDFD